MPSLSSGLPTVKPGVSRSTKKVVMPRYPYLIKKALRGYINDSVFLFYIIHKTLLTVDGFALAKTKNTSAMSEFEIHIFVPFIT